MGASALDDSRRRRCGEPAQADRYVQSQSHAPKLPRIHEQRLCKGSRDRRIVFGFPEALPVAGGCEHHQRLPPLPGIGPTGTGFKRTAASNGWRIVSSARHTTEGGTRPHRSPAHRVDSGCPGDGQVRVQALDPSEFRNPDSAGRKGAADWRISVYSGNNRSYTGVLRQDQRPSL